MKLIFGDPDSIAIKVQTERKARKAQKAKPRPHELKIGKMHETYGISAGNRCKNCIYFTRIRPGANTYLKCRIYGISHGQATDWRASYEACGKFAKGSTS